MSRDGRRGPAGLLALTSVLALATAGGAWAQSAPESEEIIVTAQKREQAIQDVPMSVSAFSAAAIEDRGLASVADIAGQLPGIKFGEFSATGTISMRGVGTTIVSGAGENSVATHIDGMFLSQPAALTMVQADLGSIEVLRGPQGTLYGRNATAGVINFISAAPTDEFRYGVTLGAGDYDRRYANAFVSGAIAPNARARLSLQTDDRSGYIDNVTTGQDIDDLNGFGGRFSLDVDLTDRWAAELRVFGRRDEFAGPVYDGFDPNFAVVPAPLVDFDPRRVASTAIYDSSKELYGAVLTNTFDIGAVSLVSVTGYADFTYEGLFDGIGSVLAVNLDRSLEAKTLSQEFNLRGAFAGGDWIVGVFYMKEEIDNYALTDFSALFGVPANQLTLQDSERTSASVFADATLALSERWSLFGGARVLSEELDQNLTSVQTTLGFPVTLCSPLTNPESSDDTAVTGRLGLQFDQTEDAMFYGQVSRGYKGGGFSQSNCNNPYDAETVNALEFGYRSVWDAGRVTFNASVFYYENEDLQLEQATPTGIPVVNAPESHVLGAEAELLWRPVDAFRLNAALTLLQAEYDEFINQDPLLGAPPGLDLSGISLNNAPAYSATIGAEYEFGLGGAGALTLRGEAYITDEYNVREFNLPWTVQDGYTQLNFSAIWDSPMDRVRVRGFVRNATDEDVLGGVLGFGGAIGSFQPPRTYGLELTLRN